MAADPPDDILRRFSDAPVGRLATVTAEEAPHIVPVVFALSRSQYGHTVYTSIDGKPKSTRRLRRLANIAANPRVSLLVDHYEDDWARLWWVRADGIARVHHDGVAATAGKELLRSKYAQYLSVSLQGPVIEVRVARWSWWG